eukprot:2869874-Pyramimonas_sp.AAC.1
MADIWSHAWAWGARALDARALSALARLSSLHLGARCSRARRVARRATRARRSARFHGNVCNFGNWQRTLGVQPNGIKNTYSA